MQSIRKVHALFVVCMTALAAVLFVPSVANVASAQSVGNGQAWTAMITEPVGGGDPFSPTTVKRIFAYPTQEGSGNARVAYCLNYENLHPKAEDKVGYTSERVSGDIAGYIVRQKSDAEQGIRNAIYNGYTGDAQIDRADIRKKFGLTEDEFYLATQYAVWRFSDNKELPDDYSNAKVRDAIKALIGEDSSVNLVEAPADLDLHVLKTEQKRMEDDVVVGQFQNLVVANMIQGSGSVSGSEGGEIGFEQEAGAAGIARSAAQVQAAASVTNTTSDVAVSVEEEPASAGQSGQTDAVEEEEEQSRGRGGKQLTPGVQQEGADDQQQQQATTVPNVPREAKLRIATQASLSEVELVKTGNVRTVYDTVALEGLKKYTDYTLRARLVNPEDVTVVYGQGELQFNSGDFQFESNDGKLRNAKLAEDGQTVSGEVVVQIAVDEKLRAGQSAVVFEELYLNGDKVAEHADATDAGQTVTQEEEQGGSIWPWVVGGLTVGGLVAGSSGSSSAATSTSTSVAAAASSTNVTAGAQKSAAGSGKTMLANTGASILVLMVAALLLLLGGVGLLRLRNSLQQ